MSPSPKSGIFSDEPWLSIERDRESKWVYAEWKGFANSAEFRASLIRIVEAIKVQHVSALVSDNRRLEGITSVDQLWIRDTWTPMAVEAGLKRIAVVVAHHGLGKIASEETLGRLGTSTFATRTFTTVSEATEWAAEI